MNIRFFYALFFSLFFKIVFAQMPNQTYPYRYAFNEIFKKGTETAVFEIVFSCSGLEWEEKFDSTARRNRYDEYVADLEDLQKEIDLLRDACHIEITEKAVFFDFALDETHSSILIPVPKYLLSPYAYSEQIKGLKKPLLRY
ncbi:MAG: hypothetical protein RLZZ628_3148 [Bacteroidota bacterium]